MEEYIKYWLEEDKRKCVFCEIGKDSVLHYIKECEVTKEWFEILGREVKERFKRLLGEELDDVKEGVLIKLQNEKEKVKKAKWLEKRDSESNREVELRGEKQISMLQECK